MRPFVVRRDGDGWLLIARKMRGRTRRNIIWCETQAECIDYAYRNWPWWL